jgi:hypothetical protein
MSPSSFERMETWRLSAGAMARRTSGGSMMRSKASLERTPSPSTFPSAIPEAALELIRTQLYLERLESDAGAARRVASAGGRGRISGEVRSISVVARGEELERLTSYAEARGWDVSTAARHLVLSALKQYPA